MRKLLAILLDKDEEIESVRKNYVPNHDKYEPHITLVYPFEFDNEAKLKDHIAKSLKGFKPFSISLEGLQKSAKEFYLYLLVKDGKDKVLDLKRKLNGELLSRFKNLDMPRYIPHLTIGVFESEKQIEKAIENVPKIKFESKVSSIALLTIDDNDSLVSKEYFSLD